MMFFLVPVNYLAILACGVAAMVVGFLWYGPLFGKRWSKLVGSKINEEKMGQTYALSFGLSLVMAWFLAHVIWYAAPGSVTMFIGIKTAVYMWLGFVATTLLTKHLYSVDKKPLELLMLEGGYHLVTLVVMSVVIVGLGMS